MIDPGSSRGPPIIICTHAPFEANQIDQTGLFRNLNTGSLKLGTLSFEKLSLVVLREAEARRRPGEKSGVPDDSGVLGEAAAAVVAAAVVSLLAGDQRPTAVGVGPSVPAVAPGMVTCV